MKHPFEERLDQDWREHPSASHPRGSIEGGFYRTRNGSLWGLDEAGRCLVHAPGSWVLTSAEARRVANASRIYIALCDEPREEGSGGASPVSIHYYSHIGVLNMVDGLDDLLHERDPRQPSLESGVESGISRKPGRVAAFLSWFRA